MKMISQWIVQIFFIGLIFGLSGCSNQWREADQGVFAEDAFALLEEVAGQAQSFNGGLINELKSDPNSIVYFTESGEAFGAPASVMSFADLGFLGLPVGTNIFQLNPEYVGVVLLDGFSSSGQRHFALLIKYVVNGQTEYFSTVSAANDFEFTDKKFEVFFDLKDGSTLMLRSFDVSTKVKEDLNSVIHLKAFILQAGQEFAAGQFSTLQGFGG